MPQAQPQVTPRRAQLAQHPRHQTMGDFDSSDAFFLDRNPIRPPQPPRNDFEIKPQIIALVKQNQFHGLSTEHSLNHVDTFQELCSTTRINGVSPDYFKCKLFTFSLSDKVLRWVKSLPPKSITTWNEYKGAFLNQFYTKQRSNFIRSKISGFKQAPMESFYEALERFKEYTRDCLIDGFSKGNLWNIFYNGIDHTYKLSLDTANNWNFMTKSVPEAKLLIENLALSDANACPDYNRMKTGPDGSNRESASKPCGMADRGTSVPRSANVRTLRPSRLNARPTSHTDPEASSRGRPICSPATVGRARPHRASRRQRLTTVRHNSCHMHDPSVRPGRPRPTSGRILRPNHPSGRTRRTNEESLGHDRPDRADSRSSPDSRPNVPNPKPFLKPVSHVSSPITRPTY
ncbi:unnamed protein product [Microthlaspi erraticum]|uniref:Retrotransposon gag domain-containing protein n=1 Tax=Microthlaspi erraticum TaxID=1685480 RepID=A0A6D2JI43_9BRAS|nr:unnamed protein product [Microthlaspi erraticum]